MGGKARFDCRMRNMREKEKVIRGWGEGGRHHIYVGLNWIMIFLSAKELLWQAAHTETVKSGEAVGGTQLIIET